jgi:hypothetical protein
MRKRRRKRLAESTPPGRAPPGRAPAGPRPAIATRLRKIAEERSAHPSHAPDTPAAVRRHGIANAATQAEQTSRRGGPPVFTISGMCGGALALSTTMAVAERSVAAT